VLEGPNVYASIVRVPSVEAPYLSRIAPGDPERSWIWIKLIGCFNQIPDCQANPVQCGAVMPMNSPISEGFQLSEAAVLYDWIRAGAPN
jgi:hypothetical protein